MITTVSNFRKLSVNNFFLSLINYFINSSCRDPFQSKNLYEQSQTKSYTKLPTCSAGYKYSLTNASYSEKPL